MDNNKTEQLLETIFKDRNILKQVFGSDKAVEDDSSCLSDEKLTELLENQLSNEEVEAIFGHFAFCNTCMEIFISTHETIKTFSVKDNLLTKIEAYKNKLKRFTFMIKTLPDRIAPLIMDSGLIPMQGLSPATVRSGHRASDTNHIIRLKKEVKPFQLELEIEKTGRNDYYNIQIIVKDLQSGKLVPDLRLSLVNKGIEVESFMSKDGAGAFEDLEPDRYLMVFTQKGNKICEFDMSFI